MGTVAIVHHGVGAVKEVPDDADALAIYFEAGWEPVPDDVNLADPEAVAALAAGAASNPSEPSDTVSDEEE